MTWFSTERRQPEPVIGGEEIARAGFKLDFFGFCTTICSMLGTYGSGTSHFWGIM